MNVAVLGASNKPARYSYQAVKLLAEKGHAVFPIHPVISEIEGIPVFKRLADITAPIPHNNRLSCPRTLRGPGR